MAARQIAQLAPLRGNLVVQDLVALAASFQEPGPVEDADGAAPVLDQPILLQLGGRHRNGRPADPQHVGQEFLGQGDLIAFDEVFGLQEPARQAAFERMQGVAGGVLLRLRPEGDGRAIGMVMALSILVHPAIAWTLGTMVFDLSTDQLRSAVVTASMAPGVNAYLFANAYGVAKRVAASAVLLATLASIGTIWMWLHILP